MPSRLIRRPVELHFALGSLFRRRGETERAIRMHQNLSSVTICLRILNWQALSELGQDYLKAGLLDRAEEVFDKLRESNGRGGQAQSAGNLSARKGLGESHRIAGELPDVASRKEIAEYYCELAAAEMIRSRVIEARAHLLTALEPTANACAPACCRAILRCSRIAI
jgi:lipopolysaccharide biosynthesis regulator YciM